MNPVPVLAGILVLAFGVLGTAKLAAVPAMRSKAEHVGFTVAAYRRIGALELLAAVGLRTPGERDARVLLVLQRDEDAVWKSFRNLGVRVQIVIPDELNTYDVLVNDWLVFSKATLEAAVTRFSGKSAEADAEGDEEAAVDEDGGSE